MSKIKVAFTMDQISYSKLINDSGFTLIEVMVTVTVIGIIAAIAAPNISTQLANQRIKSTAATLESILKEARSESVIRRLPVRVSYINDKTSNSINIEVPYSGPLLSYYSTTTSDWSALFMNSAVASDSIWGKRPGGNNNSGSNNNNNNNNSNTAQNGSSSGTGTGGNENESGSNDKGSIEGGNTENKPETGGQNNADSGSNSVDATDTDDNKNIEWVIIENYNYNSNSKIVSLPKKVTFEPSKQTDHAITYTICDTNKSATPKQIIVSKLGIISTQSGGSC